MSVEEKIKTLGITLPAPPRPVAAYVPGIEVDGFVLTSGQLPVEDGELRYRGRVGAEVTPDEGYAAARLCALNCLSVVRDVAGSLDRVERVVRICGYVRSGPGFTGQPVVINGASDLVLELFGAAGRHARAAVGAAELPMGAAVELEMLVKLKRD